MAKTKNKYQVMPPLSDEEYQALKEDMAENGMLVPVVQDTDGNIIDGHYRVRAHQELVAEGRAAGGIPTEERSGLTEDQKRDLAWRLNMQRRHLSSEQKRGAIERKLEESPEWAANRIAKLLGVDDKTVRFMRVWLEGRKEIPKVKKVVGADGKEYPRELEKTREPEKRLLEKQFKDKGFGPEFAEFMAETALPTPTLTRERAEGPLRWPGAEVGEEHTEPREPGVIEQLEDQGVEMAPYPSGPTAEERAASAVSALARIASDVTPEAAADSMTPGMAETTVRRQEFLLGWMRRYIGHLHLRAERS
jgi:ParB-like chromosome segregation protein Spo0J